MVNSFFKAVFKQKKYSYEMQNFNLVQLIYYIGLVLLVGVIYVCIPDHFYVYISILMTFLLLASFIDANVTGRVKVCAVIVSVISNFIYLPLCFYGFGKIICCVPLYYILGILYSVLLIQGKLGIILSICETVYLCFITIHLSTYLPSFYVYELSKYDYIAIGIAIMLVGILAVIAIRTKIVQYDFEIDNMKEAQLKVSEAYSSKDIFFANTSHEIRTPLNAIVGTVQLLLDEDLDSKARENVYNILNSCNALLSITNELIELSNTENNDVNIQPRKYDFSELLIEVVNMMSVRLIESEVSLHVDIDNKLPRYLVGDDGKVRQLFINILNNAVKYTKEGKITLKVTGEKKDDNKIIIKVSVKDTGIGIKEDAMKTLFSDFTRDDEDAEKRIIEGTGLGLSLCKDLVEKMGGNIWAESEYHVGTTFYFNIEQGRDSYETIARVPSSKRDAAIIFENNEELADELSYTLGKLNISSVKVFDRMAFEDCVISGKYGFLFISSERYMDNKRVIDKRLSGQRVVIITDISKSVQVDRNAYIISRPVYLVNAAMAYNNVVSTYTREIISKGGFTCPDTTILVVDDNMTNLDVATNLLNRYGVNVITALSGTECLNALENNVVDIIFMDYMMPEMNGIDTLHALRKLDIEYCKKIPVIALTANVVSGAREMFLEAGFAEYISKPIESIKLEKALRTFLSKEKIKVNI